MLKKNSKELNMTSKPFTTKLRSQKNNDKTKAYYFSESAIMKHMPENGGFPNILSLTTFSFRGNNSKNT